MNILTFSRLMRFIAILVALPLANGCGNKEPAANAPPPVAQTDAASTTAPEAPTPARGPSPQERAALQAMWEQARQAEAAAKAREYEQAVDAMLALQREQARWAALSEQQAARYQQQMQWLQAEIAAAAASGDPRARAAAARLRRSATYR